MKRIQLTLHAILLQKNWLQSLSPQIVRLCYHINCHHSNHICDHKSKRVCMGRKEGLPISFARCRSSLYLFQKSEDLPIFESFTMTDGPNLRKLASSLPLSASFSVSSKLGRSPADALRLTLTKAAFCFSNHAQLLLGSPAKDTLSCH